MAMQAIKLAYKVADENYIRGGNNRIILATDGEFALNDEITSADRKIFEGGYFSFCVQLW